MPITEQAQNIYQPNQMRSDYTRYYLHHDSDSPQEARAFLRDKILISILKKLETQSSITILDMGGGKQIFEFEVAHDPRFAAIQNKIFWITVDISEIPRSNMLATNVAEPIEADGSQLPLPADHFDIVFSSMAIDFMPRKSFEEVQRVLKNDGDFYVNFHHPNLIAIAQQAMPEVLKKLARAKKNYQMKVKYKSTKLSQAKEKLVKAEIEFKDVQFILNHFPNHIFHNLDEIYESLSKVFIQSDIRLIEHQNVIGKNGWFYAQVLLNI